MAITGTVPLSKFQAAWELPTRGTQHSATTALPIIGGDLNHHRETSRRIEQRNSLLRHYRAPIVTKEFAEVSGMEVVPTFEEIGWYLGAALKKVQSGTLSATAVYTYLYTTTTGSDDLQTATLEVGDDTSAFFVPFAVINRLTMGWEEGGPFTMTMDWLGQRAAIASTFSSGLTMATSEEINPAEAFAYIDATTIGTTAAAHVQALQFSIDNHFVQHWAPDGLFYPNDVYRSEPRSMEVEGTLDFPNTTEYIAFASTTERKIRIKINGSTITSSSPATPKSLQIDAYVYWDEAPFSKGDVRTQLRFRGETVYDATATFDWRASLVTSTARYD